MVAISCLKSHAADPNMIILASSTQDERRSLNRGVMIRLPTELRDDALRRTVKGPCIGKAIFVQGINEEAIAERAG